jgi:hypothetical protein
MQIDGFSQSIVKPCDLKMANQSWRDTNSSTENHRRTVHRRGHSPQNNKAIRIVLRTESSPHHKQFSAEEFVVEEISKIVAKEAQRKEIFAKIFFRMIRGFFCGELFLYYSVMNC